MPRAIDLYAGAGGTTYGLTAAGFEVAGAIECDADAVASYTANFPSVPVLSDDIRKVDAEAWRADLAIDTEEIDLITACPPCQGFSTLGGSRRDDPRNELVLEIWKFIREFRPRAYVIENVPGLANDERLARLVRQTRAVGYGVRMYRVDAVEFDVPQYRRRMIVIGTRDKSAGAIPSRLNRGDGKKRSVRDVFEFADKIESDSDPIHRARRLAPATLERVRAVPEGGSRFHLPEHLQLECHKRLDRRNATSSYGRMRIDEPAPTMSTRCTTPACGRFIHPWKDRGLTLREAALIQTFPSDFAFVGTYGGIERQIGNALPVFLARDIGVTVRELVAA